MPSEGITIPKSTQMVGKYAVIPHRIVSSGIIGRGYQTTEFPEDVLKTALDAGSFEGIPACYNHWISDTIGVFKDSFLEKQFVNPKTNKVVGAGIAGNYYIDTETHKDIASKAIGDPENKVPPSINASSISVFFEYKQSHDFSGKGYADPEWEFRRNLGKEIEGSIVRYIATKITRVAETSLVSLAADENATTRVGMQKQSMSAQFAENPDFNALPAEVVASYNAGDLGMVCFEYQEDAEQTQAQEQTPPPATPEKAPEGTTQVSLAELQAQFEREKAQSRSLVVANQSLRDIYQVQLTEEKNKVGELQQKLALSEQALAEMRQKFEEAQKLAVLAQTFIDKERAEVMRLYRLSAESPDAGMESLIEKADYAGLQTYLKQFNQTAEGKYKATCGDCGSTNVSRRSSVPTELGSKTDTSENNSFVEKAMRVL